MKDVKNEKQEPAESKPAQPAETVVELDQVEFVRAPMGLLGGYTKSHPDCKRLQLLIGLWVRVEVDVGSAPNTKTYVIPITNLSSVKPSKKNED